MLKFAIIILKEKVTRFVKGFKMAKTLVDKLIESTTKVKTSNTKSLTITLSNENYEALEMLSKATKTSKAKIINMALDEAGVFDMNKINKKLKGVEDDSDN
jgi:uncharacterized alpha/beta hydrolase family protein